MDKFIDEAKLRIFREYNERVNVLKLQPQGWLVLNFINGLNLSISKCLMVSLFYIIYEFKVFYNNLI